MSKYLQKSYSSEIAKKTSVATYGALPGTYADLEKAGNKPLMLVPRDGKIYGTNFSKTIDFYRNYFSVLIDPENRGYGKFNP